MEALAVKGEPRPEFGFNVEVYSLDELQAIVKAEKGKKVVAFFWTNLYEPCVMWYKGAVKEAAKELENKVLFLNINADRFFDVATACFVKSTPQLIVFDQECTIVDRYTGLMPTSQIIDFITGVRKPRQLATAPRLHWQE